MHIIQFLFPIGLANKSPVWKEFSQEPSAPAWWAFWENRAGAEGLISGVYYVIDMSDIVRYHLSTSYIRFR